MKASIIRLEKVWKVYQMGEFEVAALRGVSLDIKRGDYGCFVGHCHLIWAAIYISLARDCKGWWGYGRHCCHTNSYYYEFNYSHGHWGNCRHHPCA